jgi:hypothetical protein
VTCGGEATATDDGDAAREPSHRRVGSPESEHAAVERLHDGAFLGGSRTAPLQPRRAAAVNSGCPGGPLTGVEHAHKTHQEATNNDDLKSAPKRPLLAAVWSPSWSG